MTVLQVEGAEGSRGGKSPVFSLTQGELPLELETYYFVGGNQLEGSITAMKSSH